MDSFHVTFLIGAGVVIWLMAFGTPKLKCDCAFGCMSVCLTVSDIFKYLRNFQMFKITLTKSSLIKREPCHTETW